MDHPLGPVRPVPRLRGHRLRRFLTRLLLTALAAGLVPGLLPAAAGATASLSGPVSRGTARPDRAVRVGPAFFGLHDGSLAAYGRVGFGSVRLWDTGVTWADIETSPGVYDWHRLDAQVIAAREHGVRPTMVLAMTPSFYGPASSLPPTDLSHFADYVRAVMTRYRDFQGARAIEAYQVWNEGNVPTFWTGTPHQLARLTAVVDRVRDQVDPDAVVVAPPFAVRLASQRRWLAAYDAQRVDGRPVWRYADANALSLYPRAGDGRRTGGPEDAMALLGRVRRLLARDRVPARLPMWATEINYGLVGGPGGPRAARPISERRQVANVVRTYLLGAARGLDRVFWYRYDWNTVPALGGTLGNTLLTTPGHWDDVSAAGAALDTVQRWMHGRLVGVGGRRPCAKGDRGTYTCVVVYAGGRRTILWNPTRRVRVAVRGAAYRQLAGGARTRIERRVQSVQVGFDPVLVVSPR